ncbi:MAG: TetR family transcriptional regulator [Tardiphaga sp.]|nr:TetR family transcriptional regulator [Tardiphaga sp.]
MAVATTAKQKQSTKARILACCRDLFNERGPEAVTTAEIAAAAGINEGNLYYHFQRKELMLDALFNLFENDLRATADQSHEVGEAAFFRGYIPSWFRLMWAWRFFYRDGASIHRLAPTLQPRIRQLSRDGQARTRAAIAQFARAGLMKATPDEIERVVVNGWIIATYWLDFLRSTQGVGKITPKHLDAGAHQIRALFEPYLTAKGRALADAPE